MMDCCKITLVIILLLGQANFTLAFAPTRKKDLLKKSQSAELKREIGALRQTVINKINEDTNLITSGLRIPKRLCAVCVLHILSKPRSIQ